MPPLGDLDRVHLVLRAQLTQCLLAAQRLDSYSRCELWAVGFSRRCHQPLLVNDAVRILAYCLVQIPGSTILHEFLCRLMLNTGITAKDLLPEKGDYPRALEMRPRK